MRTIRIALICLLFVSSAMAQTAPRSVPMDPNVVCGKLPNGMTYYIRHNEEPKDRASFYIIQNGFKGSEVGVNIRDNRVLHIDGR